MVVGGPSAIGVTRLRVTRLLRIVLGGRFMGFVLQPDCVWLHSRTEQTVTGFTAQLPKVLTGLSQVVGQLVGVLQANLVLSPRRTKKANPN